MRVLVCCVPQAGHFNPVLPLIRSLVAGGATEVVVAGGAALRSPAEAAGARYEPAGNSLDEWFGRLSQRTLGAPGDGLPPERISHYFVPRLFAEIGADDMIGDVLDVAEQFAPDWIIHDPVAFVGPLVTDVVGSRSVQHLFGPLIDPDVLQLAADALAPLWRVHRRDVPQLAGVYRDLTIGICPVSMEQRALPAGELLPLQPAPPPLSPPPPPSQSQSQSPPLVYVSFGTLWADSRMLRTVLDALADEPVQVVATTGKLDPAELQDVPGNARVEAFIPQERLLPGCSAVIHHAGAGTMFGALAHGLPQVAIPQAADNFLNAEALAAAGAARVLLPHDVSASSIRDAVRAVAAEPSYRMRAQQIAAEIA